MLGELGKFKKRQIVHLLCECDQGSMIIWVRLDIQNITYTDWKIEDTGITTYGGNARFAICLKLPKLQLRAHAKDLQFYLKIFKRFIVSQWYLIW